MLKVLSTIDYGQFKIDKANRHLQAKHVKDLAMSIQTHNYMPYNPIMISQDGYIIDGQHRIAAARSLKIPVSYVVVPNTNLETVRLLNANLRPWALNDFVNCFIILGNKDFKILRDFREKYLLPITTASYLLGKRLSGSINGGKGAKYIKDGTFKVVNLEEAEKMMNMLSAIRHKTDRNIWRSREFIAAFIRICEKGANPELMIEQLKASPEKVHVQPSVMHYVFVLQDIYNRNLSKNKLKIF